MDAVTREPRVRLGLIIADAKPADQRYNDEAPLAFGYFVSHLKHHAPWCEVVFRFTVEELLAERVDLVGISASTNYFDIAETIAGQIKGASGIPVVVGGVHVSVLPQSMTRDMDIGVVGEGEITVLELLESFRYGGKRFDPQQLARIPGIAFRDQGRLVVTPPRDPIADLDTLPPPDRRAIWIGRPATRAYLFTSRGCPYQCSFCASSRFWSRLRFFSAEYVAREIETVHAELGMAHMHFFDDLFIIPKPRLRRLCALLEARGLTRAVTFSGAVRANLVTDELCELLVRMNVREVMFGAESFTPRVLASLKGKNVSVEDNHRAIECLNRYGISTNLSMILGVPEESSEDLEETFRILEEYLASGKVRKWAQGMLLPYVGTPIWEEALRRGLVADDMEWSRIRLQRGVYLGGVPEPELHDRWQAHRQRCMLLRPGNAALWLEWGLTLDTAGALGRALDALQANAPASALDIPVTAPQPTAPWPESVRVLAEAADARASAGDLEGARGNLASALAEHPADPWLRAVHGSLLFRLGDSLGGIRELQSAVELDPEFPAGHRILAMMYVVDGNTVEAEAAWRAAVTQCPADLESWRALARLYFQTGRSVDGVRAICEVCRRQKNDREALQLLAAYYKARNEQAAAEAIEARLADAHGDPSTIEIASAIQWTSEKIHVYTAQVSEMEGLGRNTMVDTQESVERLTAQAIRLVEAGSFDAAIPYLEGAARVDPRAEHWANLAVGYARAGREEQAATAFQTALQRAPNDPVLREDAQAFFRQRHDAKHNDAVRASNTDPVLNTDIGHLRELAAAFERNLGQRKAEVRPPEFWYPFGTLSNFVHLDRLLTGGHRQLLRLVGDRSILDIGAADGDLAFFMESLGVSGTIVDYGPTNFNGLQGARLLRKHLGSRVEIHEVDLDGQFRLPGSAYGLVFFLGILYHLKNPYFALEALAKATRYLLLSTRTTLFSADHRVRLAETPVAYLLDADESFNRDASNYWIFSERGLERILARTGWDIRDRLTAGNTATADPASREGDMRTFVLAESRLTR